MLCLWLEVSGCAAHPGWGPVYWTSGHRVYPNYESTFVWKIPSSKSRHGTVDPFFYTNWAPTEPNYSHKIDNCMLIGKAKSYKWGDYKCAAKICSVCEVDKWVRIRACVASQTFLWECNLDVVVRCGIIGGGKWVSNLYCTNVCVTYLIKTKVHYNVV